MAFRCSTYFVIQGEMSKQEITEKLGVEPTGSWVKNSKKAYGKRTLKDTYWAYGTEKMEYERVFDMEEQCEYILLELKDKVEILKRIKRENNVAFSLVLIPEISNKKRPIIGWPLEITKFCSEIGASIEIAYQV